MAELEVARLRCRLGARGRRARAVRERRAAAGRRGSTIKVATGIASIHARTAMTMQAGWKTLSGGVPGSVPARARREPPADGGGRARPRVRQAVQHHGELPRRHGSRHVLRRRARATPPQRVLAALGPEDAAARGRARPGCAPVLRAGRAHAGRPRRRSAPARCSRPNRPWCSRPIPTKAREIARRHMATYLGLPNYTNNLQAARLDRRPTSPTAAPTRWSTPSWPGARSTRSWRG